MARDERILQVAEDLFFERGFENVGMDDIGAAAGVTGPAIYRHFSSKAEILSILFDRAIDELTARTGGRVDDDPQAELRRLIAGHAEYVVAHRRLAGIRSREERSLAEPYRRQHRRRERAYVDRWVTVLGSVYPERTPNELIATAVVITNMLNAITLMPRSIRDEVELVPLVERLVEGALQTLGEPTLRQP